MCRALMYLGEPHLVDDFLYKTDSSLIKQIYGSRLTIAYNLAGFGIVAWSRSSDENEKPFLYRTKYLPFFDRNLKQLSLKINAKCFLAHVRGSRLNEAAVISERNVHPFIYSGYQISLAHNGDIYHILSIRTNLLLKINPEVAKNIQGTTDTELVYALLMSQLPDPYQNYTLEEVAEALIKTIKIINQELYKAKLCTASGLNLFITNGTWILTTRFVFNFGLFKSEEFNDDYLTYQSLWYTFGETYGFYDNEYKMKLGNIRKSIIVASEPLTHDTTTWFEVPESFIFAAQINKGTLEMYKKYIEV